MESVCHMERAPSIVLNELQVECLRSPLRYEILSILIADGPISVTDLAPRIGYPKKSLYYPIKKLVASGLVNTGERHIQGKRPEQIFDAAAHNIQLGDTRGSHNRQSDETLVATMGVALREVARAAENPNPDLEIVCHRTVVRLSEDHLAQLESKLTDIVEFIRLNSDSCAVAYSLTMALVPRTSSHRQSLSLSTSGKDNN